ncbi:hypothetical protein RIF29_47043 [Crotalaria pallida]|uniref:Uncharacterized protein n=1 Tax=Crotalaria pallida TaxID=3830 RepID=A0AAN9HK58_CROPI
MIGRLLLLTLDCFQERPECYSLPLGQLANLLSLLYWIREIAYTLEGLLPCKSSLLLMPYPFHLGSQSIPTLALALFPRTTESPADDFLDSLDTQDPRMKPHRASLHYVERTILGLDTPIAKGTYSEPATTRERQRNRIRTLRLPYLSSPQPDLLTDLLLARRSLCLFKPKYGNVETFDAFLLEFLRQCLQLPYQIN